MTDHHFIVRVQIDIPEPPAGPPSWQTRAFAKGLLRDKLAQMARNDGRVVTARISESDPADWEPALGVRHLEGLLTTELVEGDLIQPQDSPTPVRVHRVLDTAQDGVLEVRVSTHNGPRSLFAVATAQWKVTRG